MGKLDGCGRCMKYGLCLSNFIILLGGIIVIVIGGISLYNQAVFEDLVDDGLYQSASYVLLGCGIFITLFAFLGCYGAMKEIKCFLLMYIIVLLIFFVVLMIGGVLAFVFNGKSENVEQELKDTLDDLTKREIWDRVQNTFECCGVDNYKDWKLVPIRNRLVYEEVPHSCCRSKDPQYSCQRFPTALNTWDEGCFSKFKESAHIAGSVGVVVACLTLLGLMFSYGLFKTIE